MGNYPYVTSSTTLPYAACSLGFPPQKIRHIYGAAKIYDTRSGIDPDFPESLLDDQELQTVGNVGKEYGVTTGRRRKVNWLNLDKLSEALHITGTTCCIISKTDVIKTVGKYKLFYEQKLHTFKNYETMKEYIDNILFIKCHHLKKILYSNDVEKVDDL